MDDAWAAEVIRLHMRFVVEVIEAGDFCPWARGARVQNRVEVVVCAPDALAQCVRAQRARDALEVVQIVVPELTLPALRWREEVAHLERRLRREDGALPFAFAAFHPEHPGRAESVGGAIGLLRRSPFPMLQLVRLSSLDEIRARYGARADGLAVANQAVLLEQWATDVEPKIRQLREEALGLMGRFVKE